MNKLITIIILIVVLVAGGLMSYGTKITNLDELELDSLYDKFKSPEKIAGFKFTAIGLGKALVKPDYIRNSKIPLAKVKGETKEEILKSLLVYSKDFKYNIEQPYPYERKMKTVGGNCQALSLWMQKQLTHYGFLNELYLDEGNEHMYNIVFLEDEIIKVDLSTREVKYGKSHR